MNLGARIRRTSMGVKLFELMFQGVRPICLYFNNRTSSLGIDICHIQFYVYLQRAILWPHAQV